jgi:hypothetical protein
MFHRIQQYGLVQAGGRYYRPRAYGDPRTDGTWEGWIVFFPSPGGVAIAPPASETTQSSVAALSAWAAGLSSIYFEGALARALALAQQPTIIARLTDAEYDALDDAQRLETAAEIERTNATLDTAAASAARAAADRIRQERLATETALAATEQAAATVEAETHEQAARNARAVAAAAERRRESARADAAPGGSRKRTGTRNKKK